MQPADDVETGANVAAYVLGAQIADPDAQWSVGTFGAIAEFARDRDEPANLSRLMAVTVRGGIRLDLQHDLRLFAFETTTRESWSPRVALCLPREPSAMGRRTVLTELGPDRDALRREDRDGILFDIGLDAWQVDACVRVSDPDVATKLRAHCGKPTFAPGSEAGSLILTHSPHRVFIGRAGRVEVYQPIPPAHGKSPEGPHTHVLIDLLRHRRTHAATEPIPEGLVPCAYFYPAHPAKDGRGLPRPYDSHRKAAIDAMMRQFGDPRFVALKEQVRVAAAEGQDPASFPVAGRFARTNIRVALRQLRAAGENLPSLPAWIAVHDSAASNLPDDERHIHHR
jgi:hypothetical protein